MRNILEGRLPNRVPSVAGRGARLQSKLGVRAPTSPFGQHQVVRQQRQVLARPGPATSILYNPFLLLAILLIINHLGRPFEFILKGLKIPLVLCILAAIAVVISGAIRGCLRTSVGLSLTIFIVWLLLSTPTSTWRRGSAKYALYYAGLWLVFYLILAAAPRSMVDFRRLDVIVVVACVTYMLIGSNMTAGRLAGEGTFGNSNDIALMGGFILPFLILLATRLSPVIRIIAILISGLSMVYIIGLTASRTSILGLVVMILVYLMRSRPMQSIGIIMACGIALAVLLVSLPPTTLQRLSTTFEGDAQDHQSEAAESSRSRLDLWKDAIDTTLEHPLFGIGPGQFIQYRFDHYRNPDGTTKQYLPTHQTFLEVSSEEGIPGFVIYVIFLSSIYMCIRRVIKLNVPNSHADWTFGRQMGICLEASFAYFVVFSFFITCDNHPHQFLIAGLAVALERVSRDLGGQAMPKGANKNALGSGSVLLPQGASASSSSRMCVSRYSTL